MTFLKSLAITSIRMNLLGKETSVRKKLTDLENELIVTGEKGSMSLVSNRWRRKFLHLHVVVKLLSRVRLFATPWTVAYQAPPSMEFSRQESWSGLPFPSPGDPPNSGIESRSPALQADALPSEPPGQRLPLWLSW